MREATEAYISYEKALEYCAAINNTETEEEVEAVKYELAEYLRQNGASDAYVQDWMQMIETTANELENEELILDENGNFVQNEMVTQESAEVNGQQMTTDSQANTKTGIAFGLVGAALVTGLALKKKVFKNRKNKTL